MLCAVYAKTYEVGQGKPYKTIKSVPMLYGGDIVEINSGTYREYKMWNANGSEKKPIIIRGVGSPVIDGKKLDLQGAGSIPRALFQFTGSNYVVENIEFINADNTGNWGHNGAGIRITGGKNITIRNCKITNCENGIMSDNTANILVEYCEIAYNGSMEYVGYSHNLYMGGENMIVRGCYIHDSKGGHNFKTRMHYVELLYNFIADANSAEVDLVDAKETTYSNANAVLIGNVIKKRDGAPKSGVAGNSTQFIIFGDEMKGTRNGTLFLINNTIISGMEKNKPILLVSSSKRSLLKAVCYNNIFFGSSNILYDELTEANTTGYNNWIPSDATIPPGFKDTLQGENPGFVSFSERDYHLNSSSPCLNKGNPAPVYLDEKGNSKSGIPESEYVKDLQLKARTNGAQLNIGAY